jgi:dienelactone hydrolase
MPAKDCELWTKWRTDKGAPSSWSIYPGVYHAFDIPDLNELALFRHA